MELLGSDPAIRRTLEVSSLLRLDEVHRVLQAAFEWEEAHLHDFSAGERRWDDETGSALGPSPFDTRPAPEPERKAVLGQVLVQPGDELLYTYDFGDSWEHLLTLEDSREAAAGASRARLVEAERAAPPEDCGGVYGYEELVDALSGPGNAEVGHLVEWYEEMYGDPAAFDPAYVDLVALDRRVQDATG